MSAFPVTDFVQNGLVSLAENAPEARKQQVKKILLSITPFIRSYEIRANGNSLLAKLARETGVPSLALGLIGLASLVAFVKKTFNSTSQVLFNIFGVMLPVYSSLKAIDAPKTDDDERYLTFWSIFAILNSFETAFKRFSEYYWLKLAAVYWLLDRDGALKLYRRVLRPVLTAIGAVQLKFSAVNFDEKSLPKASEAAI